MKITDIKVNPENPRTIKDDRFIKLLNSIRDFPKMMELRPIIIDEAGTILGGNMRFRAVVELGYKLIPDSWVKKASELSEEEKKRFIIEDNVPFGEWDFELLKNWDAEKLEAWGLDLPSDFYPTPEAKDDGFVMPDEVKTDIVIGDLFDIGPHRLLCGDSTDPEQILKVLNGFKPDLICTDPPYGVEIVSGGKVGGDKEGTFKGKTGKVGGNNKVKANNYKEIIGDATIETARDFYNTCISLGYKNLIIFGGNYFTEFLPPSACWVVWDKENSGNFADCELAWTSFDKGAKLYKWMWNGMAREGSRETEGKTRVHPTQKPAGLFGLIFKDFPFEVCFDGFLGSGSSMVAGHQMNKKIIGMELSPEYCQVIIDRMKTLAPGIIIKRNGEKV